MEKTWGRTDFQAPNSELCHNHRDRSSPESSSLLVRSSIALHDDVVHDAPEKPRETLGWFALAVVQDLGATLARRPTREVAGTRVRSVVTNPQSRVWRWAAARAGDRNFKAPVPAAQGA